MTQDTDGRPPSDSPAAPHQTCSADPEPGAARVALQAVWPRHQLHPSGLPWSPRQRPSEEAQLCLHQEQLISQSGLPQCVRLSFTGRKEEQLCLQHCPWTTTQPGRGQRLAGGDDKHSQPNAELPRRPTHSAWPPRLTGGPQLAPRPDESEVLAGYPLAKTPRCPPPPRRRRRAC